MKLRTRMVAYASRMSADGEPNDAWHDAMAAQALLQATKGVESDYADRNEIADACAVIRLRAAEILAGWLGEEVAK